MNGDQHFTLKDYIDQYALENPIGRDYLNCLRRSVAAFELYAGRPLTLEDLNDNLVNSFVLHLQTKTTLKDKSIRNLHGCILALWRNAFMAERVDTEPRRVRKVKVARSFPVAWTGDDLRRMLDVTDCLPGWLDFNGIKQSAFWRAFILVTYETGLRMADVLELKASDVTADGCIRIVQQKTGRAHVVQIREQTIEACRALFPPHDYRRKDVIFWWPIGKDQFFKRFRAIVTRAGLKTQDGLTRRLRRTAASLAESVVPGTAWQLLGHTTPDLANAHYIDPTVAGRKPVMPPPIPDWDRSAPEYPADDTIEPLALPAPESRGGSVSN